jgi:hypothetical protein
VRSRRCVGLFCGDHAPWIPQAAKLGALGVGILPHPCSPNRGKPLDAPSLVFWRSGLRAVFFFRSWMFACVQAGRTPARCGHDLAVEMPGASALHVAPRAAAGVSGSRPSRRGSVFCAGMIVRASRVVRTPVPRPGNAAPLSLRSSRGAAIFQRCALCAVPSCETAFGPSRPCVEC